MLIALDVHLNLPKNGLKKKKNNVLSWSKVKPDLNPNTWGTLCSKFCANNKQVLSVNELEVAILNVKEKWNTDIVSISIIFEILG